MLRFEPVVRDMFSKEVNVRLHPSENHPIENLKLGGSPIAFRVAARMADNLHRPPARFRRREAVDLAESDQSVDADGHAEPDGNDRRHSPFGVKAIGALVLTFTTRAARAPEIRCLVKILPKPSGQPRQQYIARVAFSEPPAPKIGTALISGKLAAGLSWLYGSAKNLPSASMVSMPASISRFMPVEIPFDARCATSAPLRRLPAAPGA